MRTVTHGRRQGIRLTLMKVQEHLDYADDIGLLFRKHQYAQQNAERLSKTANNIGLKFNSKKTRALRKNARVSDPVMIDGKHQEYVEEFTCLRTKETTIGDCNQEINSRISKANQAFAMPKHVLRATNLSVHTNIIITRSNVLSVLLYVAECWKKARGVLDQMLSTHSQDLLAQHQFKRKTEK